MEKQQLVSPSRQCSSTPVGFGQEFLSKEQCDNTGLYSVPPELAPADFYLFLGLKTTLKGRRFCDAIDILINAREELKRLPQNDFQEYFQNLYSLWQKCVVAQGEYFEGNVA